jgi:hypothetical protein
MAASCQQCSKDLPFDGAPCPDCATPGPAVEFFLGPTDRSPIKEELLEHLRAATAGEFKILREIGHGGMARVYLAHEIALDRQVALKVLSPLFTEYPEIVKRFQHEARTAGQLSHPHIVPVFAVYQGDGLSFFTMPFVRGYSLREILHEEGALEVDLALEYLRQAASGLSYAHEHGVVHRDVKPENIMLEETTGRIVLTDFGLAKALGSEPLTLPGDMIGTPHYMAPEQCEGDREVDGRSDQYALALVAYEMLAGEYPFDVDGFRELLMKQLNETPQPLQSHRADVPQHVNDAVHRALQKNPNKRFPSVEAFTMALLDEAEADRVNGFRRSVAGRSSVYEVKTLWMRERLVKFHSRRRFKKWSGGITVGVAASLVLYLAVAAVSGGGRVSADEPVTDPGAAQMVFQEVELRDGGTPELVGPPAPSTDDGAEDSPLRLADAGAAPITPRPAVRNPPRPVATNDDAPDRDRSRRAADTGQPGDGGTNGSRSAAANDPAARESSPVVGTSSRPAAGGRIAAPEQLLELYRQAIENEDLDELGRVVYGGEVPGNDAKMLTRIFDSAEDLEVGMDLRDTEEKDGLTIVEVDYALSYVLERTKRAQKFTLKLRMTLQDGPDGWRLVTVQQR